MHDTDARAHQIRVLSGVAGYLCSALEALARSDCDWYTTDLLEMLSAIDGRDRGAAGARRRARLIYQNSRVARRAPSAMLASFAHAMSGSTAACPTHVPNPQSVPAMTFSRPTSRA